MKNINTINSESTNVVTCAACGCIIDPEDAIMIDGETYCEDCVTECDFCGEYHLRDDMTETEDGLVCEHCLDEEYGYCECCNTWQRLVNLNWCEGDECYVCDDCLDDGRTYGRCERCGDIHHIDNLCSVYTNDCDSELWCDYCRENYTSYCDECNRDFDDRFVTVEDGCCEFCETPNQHCSDINQWIAPRGVRSYSYKPDPCFCPPEAENSICFGFELEMEDHRNSGRNNDRDADYMNDTLGFTYCKHDGSLDDGIELVSHPATLEYLIEHKETFRKVFDEMIQRGYTSHNNGNCGLHVHISLKPLLEANENAVSNLIIIVDNLWNKFVRFSRRTEHQLNRWAARYDSKQYKAKDVAKKAKENCGRYMAINQENKHTVEIRIFRGTLKVDTFFATLQLVQRMVDMSIACENPEKAYDITWEQLTDCDYPELKAYCEKRFAAHADDMDNIETEPVRETVNEPEPTHCDADFTMSEIDMHLSNIHIGDPIIIGSHPNIECDDRYIGMTGTVSEITEDCIYCDDLFALNGQPLRIHPLHAHRISPFRVGDYVRLVNNYFNHRGDISFSPRLETGDIGIVRAINNNIGVEFQRIFGGHNLDGNALDGHGQWIGDEDLELI